MNSITKKISIMSVLALMIVLVVYQFMGQEEPSVLLMGQENLAVTSIQEDLSLPRIEAKPQGGIIVWLVFDQTVFPL
jgi:hypothetical protein